MEDLRHVRPRALHDPVACQRHAHVDAGSPGTHGEGVDGHVPLRAVDVAGEVADENVALVALEPGAHPVVGGPGAAGGLIDRHVPRGEPSADAAALRASASRSSPYRSRAVIRRQILRIAESAGRPAPSAPRGRRPPARATIRPEQPAGRCVNAAGGSGRAQRRLPRGKCSSLPPVPGCSYLARVQCRGPTATAASRMGHSWLTVPHSACARSGG